jgi:hypothetical protein
MLLAFEITGGKTERAEKKIKEGDGEKEGRGGERWERE